MIDKYISVCGGAKAIANLKDVTIVSSGAVQGMPVTLTQWYSKPGRYASEMKSGAMMMERMVCNGERAKNTSMMGSKELVDQELNDVKQNATPFPELKYTEYRHGLALGGLTDIDGKPCVRLIVTPENATSFTEYYDAATGFKVRRVENRRSEEGTMSITTDYTDYRAVSGVFFPYSIKQNVGIEIAFTVTAVVVNKGVDAAVFEME